MTTYGTCACAPAAPASDSNDEPTPTWCPSGDKAKSARARTTSPSRQPHRAGLLGSTSTVKGRYPLRSPGSARLSSPDRARARISMSRPTGSRLNCPLAAPLDVPPAGQWPGGWTGPLRGRVHGGNYFDLRAIEETWRKGWHVCYGIAALERTCEELHQAGSLIERLREPRFVPQAEPLPPEEYQRLHRAPRGFLTIRALARKSPTFGCGSRTSA